MSATDLHTIGAVVLDKTSDTILGGIGRLRIPLQTQVRSDPLSGEVHSRFASIVARDASAEFTTRNLDALLTAVPTTGLSIATMAELAMYATKIQDGGSRATGSVHRKFSAIKGLIALTRLSCQHQGDAECTVMIRAMKNGATAPIVTTENVALPTLPTDERFTIGPITLESIVIDHIKSMDIDFGVNIRAEGGDSDVDPTVAYIESIQPTITLRGCKLLQFAAGVIPLDGKVLTQANTKMYLRKRAAGTTYVADGTAEHIRLNLAGIAVIDTAIDGTSGPPAEIDIKITPTYDGTNNPIKVTVDQAIT